MIPEKIEKEKTEKENKIRGRLGGSIGPTPDLGSSLNLRVVGLGTALSSTLGVETT